MLNSREIQAFLAPEHHDLSKKLVEWIEEHIATLPIVESDEEARVQAREILKRLGESKNIGYAIPSSMGGHQHGVDLRSCVMVRETLGSANPLADAIFALQCLGSMPITLSGNRELQEKWLPAVLRGEAMAAFAMTELEAGSDVGAISTVAHKEGEEYVLNGQKAFISNAGIADFYTVFASTNPSRGRRGLSCFLVEADRPGLQFTEAQILSAPHPLGILQFESCRIPTSNRIGTEGRGLALGLATLDSLRPTVAGAACGMAQRALTEALSHTTTRRQFDQPLSEFQLVQSQLAEMALELSAARLLTYRAAWEHDRGADRITVEAGMAKAYATEAAQRIIDRSLQLHGGRAALAKHPVEHLYRSIRSLRIYEGTTEIQHLIIARHLLDHYRQSSKTPEADTQ